jgi:hypothetical protein
MEEIALKTQASTEVERNKVREVLDAALRREADLASARHAYFEHMCRAFEQQHHISSDEFMEQFESGALGDDAEYFDWYAGSTCGCGALASYQGSTFERPRLLPRLAEGHSGSATRSPHRYAVRGN